MAAGFERAGLAEAAATARAEAAQLIASAELHAGERGRLSTVSGCS
jgi:hypothetical protein